LKAALVVLLVVLAVGVPSHDASSATATAYQPSGPDAPRTSWEGVAIVVNQRNPVDNMTLWQLRQVFSGERHWWGNRRHIALVTLPRGAAERLTVLRVIYRMSETDLEKEFFFGKFRGEFSSRPTTLPTPEDVRKFVSGRPGAIGFLRASDVDASLKVVRINGLLPEDDGYPMRLRVRIAK
jgi:ABC-type phosphate transport system substrate-binding protein